MSNAFNTGEFAIATPKQFTADELRTILVSLGGSILACNKAGDKDSIPEYANLQKKVSAMLRKEITS